MKTQRPTYFYPEPDVSPSRHLHSAIDHLEAMTEKDWKLRRDEALQDLRHAADWVDAKILHEKRARVGGLKN